MTLVSQYRWERITAALRREVIFAIIFLLALLCFLPYLFTSTRFYISSDTLVQAQFGDAPGAIWTLWIYSRNHLSFNTNQINTIFGGRSLWEFQTYSQAIWIIAGAFLNRVVSPIRAFNLLVLINFYLAARSSLFAIETFANKATLNFFVIITCTMFPFIIWAVGGPSAIVGFFPIPLFIGLLTTQIHKNNKKIFYAATILLISVFTDVVIMECCLIITLSYFTVFAIERKKILAGSYLLQFRF